MIVNNSDMAVGNLPFSRPYNNWFECWRHLNDSGKLYSRFPGNIFTRRFRGPWTYEDGQLAPSRKDVHFGPMFYPQNPLDVPPTLKPFYENASSSYGLVIKAVDALKAQGSRIDDTLGI